VAPKTDFPLPPRPVQPLYPPDIRRPAVPLHGELVRYLRDFREYRRELDRRIYSIEAVNFVWRAGNVAPTVPDRQRLLTTHAFAVRSIVACGAQIPIAGVSADLFRITFNIEDDTGKRLFLNNVNFASLCGDNGTANQTEFTGCTVFEPGATLTLNPINAAGFTGDLMASVLLLGDLISAEADEAR